MRVTPGSCARSAMAYTAFRLVRSRAAVSSTVSKGGRSFSVMTFGHVQEQQRGHHAFWPGRVFRLFTDVHGRSAHHRGGGDRCENTTRCDDRSTPARRSRFDRASHFISSR